ncbi:MAG: hypothetical protein KatS3mg014_2521 [Actinomycetota bacterium]|nr:MAG: hypothetical protein KatS3mg014_2484 [Actinomycetota bacterium]GIV00906.1 MAG: hypothetical protein KatS3mg014_2521 [Actinomycetota bacterium]
MRPALRAFILRRDGRCLLAGRGGCAGPLEAHHIRKRSQGGRDEERNLVALCALHNTWVEDHPAAAWELGLVARAGDRLADCWHRMRSAGLTSWDY